jgi:hypothetical protein
VISRATSQFCAIKKEELRGVKIALSAAASRSDAGAAESGTKEKPEDRGYLQARLMRSETELKLSQYKIQ